MDDGLVHLRLVVDERCEARRTTKQQDEQSSRKWIEGAQMPDAPLGVSASRYVDDIVRCDAGRLVDQERAESGRRLRYHVASRRP